VASATIALRPLFALLLGGALGAGASQAATLEDKVFDAVRQIAVATARAPTPQHPDGVKFVALGFGPDGPDGELRIIGIRLESGHSAGFDAAAVAIAHVHPARMPQLPVPDDFADFGAPGSAGPLRLVVSADGTTLYQLGFVEARPAYRAVPASGPGPWVFVGQ
jgi:hypothetical protein